MAKVSDDMLLEAVRARILSEIQKKEEQRAIVNNIYGGGGAGGAMPSMGVADQLGTAGGGEDPYDYFVDIVREDLPEINEHTGKPVGWRKSVQRYRKPKTDDYLDGPKKSQKKK